MTANNLQTFLPSFLWHWLISLRQGDQEMHIAKVKMFLLRISYFEDDVFILENNMVCGLVCVCPPDTKGCVASQFSTTKDIDQAITHLLHCASSVGNLDALPFIPILTSIVWRVMWEESASKAVSV